MVLRAFAAHSRHRHIDEARSAGEHLKTRFFKPDKYNDRKASHYWLKFQYPFWWTNILTALDSLSLMGFSRENEKVQRGLDWFLANQEKDGLWDTSYGKGKKARETKMWGGLAVCRVLKRFYG